MSYYDDEFEQGFDYEPPKIAEYRVWELSDSIKNLLESNFRRIRVRGEITELKRASSGHAYLALKDERGKISAVIWRSQVPRLALPPENGLEVVVTGRISAYGERSSYQVIIEKMEYAGEGALLAQIEKLKQKCLAAGLFDRDRKKPIPFLPKTIGLVTSENGAVLHDILTTVQRRLPRDLILWPVPVQGADAPERIARAIDGFSKLKNPPDTIIVARGGGSLEDLMAFNAECVLLAVANCPIPIISAVGHETDTTLIDFVSDRRAPTPTAAAEMAVPLKSELQGDLAHRQARLIQATRRLFRDKTQQLRAARLPEMTRIVDQLLMRIADREERLHAQMPHYLRNLRAKLNGTGDRLRYGAEKSFAPKFLRAERADLRPRLLQGVIDSKRERLNGLLGRLDALDPKAVLKRGFVFVETENGEIVTESAQLPEHSLVNLVFNDGRRSALTDPEKRDLFS